MFMENRENSSSPGKGALELRFNLSTSKYDLTSLRFFLRAQVSERRSRKAKD